MPKRFTDTDKWKKALLRQMPAEYKLLWLYICDDCNHAGIWHVDLEVAALRIGETVSKEKAIEVFKGKVVVFDGGEKWFIPSFIEFQYGSELNEKNKVHLSVINELNKYGLEIKPHASPMQGAKEKDKEKEMDMEQERKGGMGEKQIVPQMLRKWVEKNENYPTDEKKDAPALLNIARFISAKQALPFAPSDSSCVEAILTAWSHLCDHIPKHNFYKNYSIQQVEKHIQSIVLSIQNGESNSVNGKSNQPLTSDALNKAYDKYFG